MWDITVIVGLGRYKWYQSQTLGNVPARRLFPEGGKHGTVLPIRTLGPEEGWVWWGSHIDGRKEQVPASSPEGVDCDIPCWLGRRTKHRL